MRAVARIFATSYALASRLPVWAKSAHSFLWLHVLSKEALNELNIASYTKGNGQDFGSKEHNNSGLWDWEQRAVEEFFTGRKSVLVAGAGGGREMIALAKMGYQVSGFDASDNLVRACERNLAVAGIAAPVSYAPAGQVPAGPRTHDALVVGRGVYHHIPGRRNRVKFLKDCRRRIKEGSPLLLGDFHLKGQGSNRLTKFALLKKVEVGDSIGSSFFHYFDRTEIYTELDSAGFDVSDFVATPFPGSEGKLAHVIARSRCSPTSPHFTT